MNILIATNAFKHGLTATAAASAIERGFARSSANYECACFPVADGGDGTAKLIVERCSGYYVDATVLDPLGRSINATFGLIDDGATAVIEMADASGLRLLSADELAPMHASSYGTGMLIKSALDTGANKIILCMGGSATVDGGAGILSALGLRFFKSGEEILQVNPKTLTDMDNIDLSGLDQRLAATDLTILCDVNNRLLGESGAAPVFGPQKGASAADVKQLASMLSRFRDLVYKHTKKDMALIDHGGAAGGAAAGLSALLNAKLVNGIDYFLKITDFDTALKKCDLVITGEGSIDEQTLHGKGPYGVAYQAKLAGLPVIAFAGKVPLRTNKDLHHYFNVLMPIGNEPCDLETAIQFTAENLERTAFETGNMLKIFSQKTL